MLEASLKYSLPVNTPEPSLVAKPAMSLYWLSDLRYKEDSYDEAEKAAQESMDVFRRTLAARAAEPYLRQTLDIRTRISSKGNIGIGTAEAALGEYLTAQKRHTTAEPLLLESYQIFES